MPDRVAASPDPARFRQPLTRGGRERLERGDLGRFDVEMYANMGTGALEETLDRRNVERPATTGRGALWIGVAVGSLFAFVNVVVGLRTGLLFAGGWIVAYAIGVGARDRAPALALAAGAAATSSLVAAGAIYAAPAVARLAGMDAYAAVGPMIPALLSSLFLILAAGALLGHAASRAARRSWVVREPLPFRGTAAEVRLLDRGDDASPAAARRARQGLGAFFAGLGASSVFALLRDVPVLGGKSALESAADRVGAQGTVVDGVVGQSPGAGHFTSVGFELSPLLGAFGWFLRASAAIPLAIGSFAAWFVAVPLAVAFNVPVLHRESGGMVGLESLAQAGLDSAPLAFSGPVRVLAVGALLGASLATFLRLVPALSGAWREVADGVDAPVAATVATGAGFAAAGLAVAGAPWSLALLGGVGLVAAFVVLGPFAIRSVGEGQPETFPALTMGAFALLALVAAATTNHAPSVLTVAILGAAGFATAVATGAGGLQSMRTSLYAGVEPRAPPRAHLAGLAAAALAAAGAGVLFASAPVAAPQGNLLATLAQPFGGGPFDLTLLVLGLGFGIVADLALRRGFLVALGLFLPIAVVAPLLLGATAREFWERRRAALAEDRRAARRLGTLLVGAGLIVGESLATAAFALLFT